MPTKPETLPLPGEKSDQGGRFDDQGGWILPMMGLLIIPLIIMTAFAVDIGVWYAQSAKLQRASDNAALAGVVWMPNEAKARLVAQESLRRSGYNPSDFSLTFPTQEQMQVSGSEIGTRYFSNVFMEGTQHLNRSGTATFNDPVPLGSPANKSGNDVGTSCAQSQPVAAAPCGPQPMLWQAIQGPYEVHANGDPYTTLCPGDTESVAVCGTPAAPLNPDYRPDGYEFAIDVPLGSVGTPITFQVWDAVSVSRTLNTGTTGTADCTRRLAPFNNSSTLWPTSGTPSFSNQYCQTGDSGRWSDRNSIPMQFQVFENDGSDLSVSYDVPKTGCELYLPRGTGSGATAADTTLVNNHKNRWATICTFTPTAAGIYPVRVKSSNIVRPSGTPVNSIVEDSGWNAYSLKLVTTGSATLYNLNHISIWTNSPGSEARFYLAKIGQEHRGKKIVLDLFDPGDGSGSQTYQLQVLAPPTASPFNTPAVGSPLSPPQYGRTIPATGVVTSCRANTSGSTNKGGGTLTNATNCNVVTRTSGTQNFQNSWLRFEIVIDPNYTCSTDCWWTIRYNFGSGSFPNDRTVWSLAIVGDPVHLVD